METTSENKTQSSEEKEAVWPNRSLKESLGVLARGFAMGSSDIVPGVSGGTIAFIFGIYEELIGSIRTAGQPEFWRALLKFQIKELFRIVNWKFLLALGSGILLAIITLAGLLESALVNYPVYIWSFFFGLVLASVFVVSKRIKQWNPVLIVLMIIGTVGSFFLVGLVPVVTPTSWWFLILVGALASCALILPGISGAFILVLLGKYEFVLGAVNGLRGGDISNIWPIMFIGIGAVLGLVTLAQILGWLFKNYHDYTVAILIGFMLGSLRKIWPWKKDVEWLLNEVGERILDSDGHFIVIKQFNILPDFSTQAGITEFIIAFGLALVGVATILLINRYAADLEEVETIEA